MVKIFNDKLTKVFKIIVFIILEVIIFFYLNDFLDIMTIPDIQTAFLIIMLITTANILLWPLVSYLSLKFFVLTLGIGTFAIDGIILAAIVYFIPEVSMKLPDIITAPMLIGIINVCLSFILNLDNDDIYQRYIIKKCLKNQREVMPTHKGFIFLEIDGLAYDIMREAIINGDMPTVKEWIDNKSHKLSQWETDLSSQTSSSQAGILHGNNNNIPAFRWVEKENDNRIVSSNGFSDAALIEDRISNHKGLLHYHGASRSNLFSGDAEDYILTLSKFSDKNAVKTKTWYYLYSEPYFIARVLLLMIWDCLLELLSRIYHRIKNIEPRLPHRGLVYFIARAGANVLMREASTAAIIGDIFSGNYDVIYTTYMGYDEIAHHSGIRDKDAFYALRQIDKQFSNIQKALDHSNRDFDIIVLSDHGQSEGPTFKMKYKITLEDLVKTYLPEHVTVHSILYSNNDHFFDQLSITNENSQIRRKAELNKRQFKQEHENFRNFTEILKDKIVEKSFFKGSDPLINRLESLAHNFGFDINLKNEEIIDVEDPETIVLASGNLGLIYFTRWAERMTYEQLEDAFPGLVKGIAAHPGIGFVMVRSSIYGTIIFSGESIYFMNEDRYDGEPFLDKFGSNVVDHLRRTDGFEHVPDILVNSNYDVENDHVYAFEELLGSHGGVGSTQQEPFILHPSDWILNKPLIGAEAVHKFFKREIIRTWKLEHSEQKIKKREQKSSSS